MVRSSTITLSNLRNRAARLRGLLGEELFHRLWGGFDTADIKGLANFKRQRARAHPFAVGWDELVKGIEQSETEGTLRLSEAAIFLLDALHSLSVSTDDPEIANVLKKLAGKEQYYSTVFETFVFAGYRALNEVVVFVPESADAGARRPDLCVSTESGGCVHIECKSLLDDIEREESAWSEVEIRIAAILDKMQLNARVHIMPSRLIANQDADALVAFVKGKLSESRKPATHIFGNFTIEITELLADGQTLPLPLKLPYNKDGRGLIEAEIDAVQNAVVRVWGVEAQPYLEIEQRDRVADLLRVGSEQLPNDQPGLVHLQVPYRRSAHFLDVVDRARSKIESVLSRRQHICAVVLSGRFINPHMASDGSAIADHYAIIPNFSAQQTLPPDFRLLGSEPVPSFLERVEDVDLTRIPDERFDVLPEGTITMTFGIFSPLMEQIGRYLMRFCAADGRRQLSVWQTYQNRFQIEVVHEHFGRRELTTDLNNLSVYKDHKMAFSWSKDGISLAVDGKLLS
jgi:hypothetical protein